MVLPVVTFPMNCPACQAPMNNAVEFKQHVRNKIRNRKSTSISTTSHLALIDTLGEAVCLGIPRKPREPATVETVIPSPVKPPAGTKDGVLFTIGSVARTCLPVIDITSMSTMTFPGLCPAKCCTSRIESLQHLKKHLNNCMRPEAAKLTRVNHRLLLIKLPPDFQWSPKLKNSYVRK